MLESFIKLIQSNIVEFIYKSRLEDQMINAAIKLNKANITQSKRIAIQNKTIIETLKSIYQTILKSHTYNTRWISVPKVPFRFFDKLKNEIQNSILRNCF